MKSDERLVICYYLHDPVDEGTFGKRSWAINRLAIIFGTPRSAVNVDMVGIKAECSCFNGVINCSVKHTNATDAGIKGYAHTAIRIKSDGSYFTGASRPVFIVAVISRHRVVIVVVDV